MSWLEERAKVFDRNITQPFLHSRAGQVITTVAATWASGGNPMVGKAVWDGFEYDRARRKANEDTEEYLDRVAAMKKAGVKLGNRARIGETSWLTQLEDMTPVQKGIGVGVFVLLLFAVILFARRR